MSRRTSDEWHTPCALYGRLDWRLLNLDEKQEKRAGTQAVSDPGSMASERETLQERISGWLDMPLAVLSLVWTVLVVVELAIPLDPQTSSRVYLVDTAIWFLFAAAFVVEFLIAPDKRRYLRRNVLSALSVVLPFVRAIRVLKLVRVLRSLSLARLILGANRATRAAGELFRTHQFGYVAALILIFTALGAAGTYYFEQGAPGSSLQDLGEAYWWAVTVVTTVNSGAEPVTAEARVIALLLRVVGLAVFGYLTASIATYLLGQKPEADEASKRELVETVNRLADEVVRLRAAVEETRRESGKEAAEITGAGDRTA